MNDTPAWISTESELEELYSAFVANGRRDADFMKFHKKLEEYFGRIIGFNRFKKGRYLNIDAADALQEISTYYYDPSHKLPDRPFKRIINNTLERHDDQADRFEKPPPGQTKPRGISANSDNTDEPLFDQIFISAHAAEIYDFLLKDVSFGNELEILVHRLAIHKYLWGTVLPHYIFPKSAKPDELIAEFMGKHGKIGFAIIQEFKNVDRVKGAGYRRDLRQDKILIRAMLRIYGDLIARFSISEEYAERLQDLIFIAGSLFEFYEFKHKERILKKFQHVHIFFRVLHGFFEMVNSKPEKRNRQWEKSIDLWIARAKMMERISLAQIFWTSREKFNDCDFRIGRLIGQIQLHPVRGNLGKLYDHIFEVEQEWHRTVAEETLIKLGRFSVPHLIKALQSSTDSLRRERFISILGRIGPQAIKSIPPLENVLNDFCVDGSSQIEYAAAQLALKRIKA